MPGSTYSTNLKIELMATGENSGTWGDITNTNLGTALEQAIVGYGNPDFVADADLTISITNSNSAQAARALVLNVTSVFGSLTQTRNLVVPTSQKQYIVQNNTAGGQSIVVTTSAGTGITVPNGRKAHLYVNGTDVIQMFDFVDINGGAIDGTPIGASSASTGAFTSLSATSVTNSGLTATRVPYASTGGLLVDSANMTFNGTRLTVADLADSGLTSGRVVYASTDGALVDSANLTFDGTTLTANALTTTSTVTINGGTANGVAYLNGSKVLTTGSALTFDGTTFKANAATKIQVLRSDNARGGEFFADNTGTHLAALSTGNDPLFLEALGASGNIRFTTGGTERARISTAGGLSIGTTTDPGAGGLITTGNTTLGDASTDTVTVNGKVGVGTTPQTYYGLSVGSNCLISGDANPAGIYSNPTFQSDSTGLARAVQGVVRTQATAFTMANAVCLYASDAVKGAGSTITSLHGLYVNDLTQGTNNYGITSLVSSGSNKWNIYASGTAANYFAGNVGIGATTHTEKLNVKDTSLTSTIVGANTVGAFRVNTAGADVNLSLTDGVTYSAKIGQVGGNYYVVTGGAERLRIDSSGNVGIGTSSPTTRLQIGDATVNANNILKFGKTASAAQSTLPYISQVSESSAGTSNDLQLFAGGSGAGRIILNSYDFVVKTGGGATPNGVERARITSGGDFQTSSGGSVQVGGTAARATTAGTNRLDIFDGTAPVGTLANGVSFYSTAGEARVMDAAGNATLLSPHDTETNEWIFHSKHTPTGKVLRIDVERLLKFVNDHFGLDAVQEFIEP